MDATVTVLIYIEVAHLAIDMRRVDGVEDDPLHCRIGESRTTGMISGLPRDAATVTCSGFTSTRSLASTA